MNIKQGMLISLTDNKEYIVIATIILDNVSYAYLVENEKIENIKFCIEEQEGEQIKLTEVDDLFLRQKLLMEFAKQFQQQLD